MDIGIIIARLLQIGVGIIMIVAVRYRRKRQPTKNSSNLWKIGETLALSWGWIMIVFSAYNILLYLLLNLSGN
jgi:hypothetical protein